MQSTKELKPTDATQRKAFSNWLLELGIIFSDEAYS